MNETLNMLQRLKHDLQNPLIVLRAYFDEVLQKKSADRANSAYDTPEHDTLDELASAAQNATTRISELTNELARLVDTLHTSAEETEETAYLAETLANLPYADVRLAVADQIQFIPKAIGEITLALLYAWPKELNVKKPQISISLQPKSPKSTNQWTLRMTGLAPTDCVKKLALLWKIDSKDPGFGYWKAKALVDRCAFDLRHSYDSSSGQLTYTLTTTVTLDRTPQG
jgi:hypothetical protein